MGSHLEADLPHSSQHIAAGDLLAAPVYLLIDVGLPGVDRLTGDLQQQAVLSIDLDIFGTHKRDGNGCEVCTRLHEEVILELPLVSVKDEIDPWIDVLVAYLLICRDVGTPPRGIAAEEVVDLARKFLCSHHVRSRAGADKLHAQCDRCGRPPAAPRQHRLPRCQEHRLPAAARDERDTRITLAAVGFKTQGEAAEGLERRAVVRRRRAQKGDRQS